METKKKFDYNLLIIIAAALMGILLLASYFIPVMMPSDRYKKAGVDRSYSCRDIVVAMNVESLSNLSDSQIEAYYAISEEKTGSTEQERQAGKLVKFIGILGVINAMIGGVIALCALAMIFIKSQMVKISLIGISCGGFAISIAIIIMTVIYLGLPTGAGTYAYYSSIASGAFVMLSASVAAGVSSFFIGKYKQNN